MVFDLIDFLLLHIFIMYMYMYTESRRYTENAA